MLSDDKTNSGGDSGKSVERIWSAVWDSERATKAKEVFQHPLFLAGYGAIFKNLGNVTGRILEAGGGTGRYGIQLATDNHDCHVDVIDVSYRSVEMCRRLVAARDVTNVNVIQADIFSLPFRDATYSVVVSDAVIQVFENPRGAILEMMRVLRPGGILLVSVCNYWNFHTLYKSWLRLIRKPYKYGYEKSFTHSELASALTSCGLKVVGRGGFAVSYGLARLNYFPFRAVAKFVNVFVWLFDGLTRGRASKAFGFEIFAVAKK